MVNTKSEISNLISIISKVCPEISEGKGLMIYDGGDMFQVIDGENDTGYVVVVPSLTRGVRLAEVERNLCGGEYEKTKDFSLCQKNVYGFGFARRND